MLMFCYSYIYYVHNRQLLIMGAANYGSWAAGNKLGSWEQLEIMGAGNYGSWKIKNSTF